MTFDSNRRCDAPSRGTAPASAAPDPARGLTPTLEEVRELARDGRYRRVPVRRELYADRFTPVEALRRLRAASSHCFLLESAEPDRRWGRYSFLGYRPTVEVTCVDGMLTLRRDVEGPGEPTVERRRVEHPGEAVRALLAENRSPRLAGFPPFSGGLMGYFAYDYLKYAEPTLRRDDLAGADFLDMDLMLFDRIVAFDAYRQKVDVISSVELPRADAPDFDGELARAYELAAAAADETQALLEGDALYPFEPLRLGGELAPRFDRARFGRMVAAAKRHIREGDVFQVVLSNPRTAPASGSLLDAYRALRSTNPSPYMVFLTSDDVELAAASPETLVRLQDGRLFTYPLAGTRPRGDTPEADAELERGLLADEKELAEHNMLVDLGRNDLGRVARLGSVHVERLHDVLRFSHVMHIGSTVAAELAPGRDALDVIDAVLPAGTLSGAPKLRACQVIAELEGRKRGVYGGAIGYLDLSGNMDTCIGIRLAYRRAGEVCVQSGAGIVADSDPDREYDECANKARAVTEALRAAEGGLA